MFFLKKRWGILLMILLIMLASAGCESNKAEVPKDLPSPDNMIESAITQLEQANSLDYVQKKQITTVLSGKEYYGSTITTCQETFSPQCKYWTVQEIFADYDDNVTPDITIEHFSRNDGSTLERGLKTEDHWTASLPVTGETAKLDLALHEAKWNSYWYLLRENKATFPDPLEGWINDTQTLSYYGSISAESAKAAFQKYYEKQPFWETLDDPYKMLSGIPALTLIDDSVPIVVTFNKETLMLMQMRLDITDLQKEINHKTKEVMGEQSQSSADMLEPELKEVLLLFEIKGIDTVKEISVPEGLNLKK